LKDELFDWDDANIEHIAEHGVTPEEAEEVILGFPLDFGFDTAENGEERWSYIGETNLADVLQVVITLRGEKFRVVTAFEPTKQDTLVYLKWRARQR
jgi:uncharacterized DUF497 family protein